MIAIVRRTIVEITVGNVTTRSLEEEPESSVVLLSLVCSVGSVVTNSESIPTGKFYSLYFK